MKMIKPLAYLACFVLSLLALTSCSSTGYSSGASVGYSYRHGWEYDDYYRSRVNYHYSRPAARAEIRSRAGDRAGRAGQIRGGRGGGGRRR